MAAPAPPWRRRALTLAALAIGLGLGWLATSDDTTPTAPLDVAAAERPVPDAGAPPLAEPFHPAGLNGSGAAAEPSLSAAFCPEEDVAESTQRPRIDAYVEEHAPASERGGFIGMLLQTSRLAVVRAGPTPVAAEQVPCSREAMAARRPYLEQMESEHADNPATWVLQARVDLCFGDVVAARRHLQRARDLDPEAPALALEDAHLARRLGDLEGAVLALGTYLHARPNDREVRALKARLEVEQQLDAGMVTAQGDQIVLRASPEFDRANGLVQLASRILAVRDEAARFTGATPSGPLAITIYPDHEQLMAVSCVKDWAGGLYDGTIKLVEGRGHLMPWVDLRHELIHAVALAELPSARPLWFTEGIADTFSTPKRPRSRAEELLLRNRTMIPLGSLVDTLQVMDGQDASLAYAESDVLVALLLDRAGPDAIAHGLRYLHDRGDPTKLDVALLGSPITTEQFLDELGKRR